MRESWRRLLFWSLRRAWAWPRSLRPPKVWRPRPEPLQWWTTKLTNKALNVRPQALPSLVESLVLLPLGLYLLLDTVEGSDKLLDLAVQSYVLSRASLRGYPEARRMLVPSTGVGPRRPEAIWALVKIWWTGTPLRKLRRHPKVWRLVGVGEPPWRLLPWRSSPQERPPSPRVWKSGHRSWHRSWRPPQRLLPPQGVVLMGPPGLYFGESEQERLQQLVTLVPSRWKRHSTLAIQKIGILQ